MDQLCLSKTNSIYGNPNELTNARAVQELVHRGVVKAGDLVVITKGDYVNAQGGTNTMKIVQVGSDIR